MLTVGIAWFLAALGAYVRDLGHMIGYLLTLWFFLTPICYPETALPEEALGVLGKNPLWTLVRSYRLIFLEGRAPEWAPLLKLACVAGLLFFAGHALFYRLRRRFADII
jgi:lipopolysaccharide transport system permease protein